MVALLLLELSLVFTLVLLMAVPLLLPLAPTMGTAPAGKALLAPTPGSERMGLKLTSTGWVEGVRNEAPCGGMRGGLF